MTPRQRQSKRGNARAHADNRADAAASAETTAAVPAWLISAVSWLAVAAVVFVLTYRPVIDGDMWFHLETGHWILDNNQLPRTDPFSYTAGDTPYVPSGWLTAVLLAALDNMYPESSLGPILMVTVAAALAAIIILARAWQAGTIIATALVLMTGLALAVTRFHPRPDVWSLVGIAALLSLLSAPWRTGRDGTVDGDNPPAPWSLWILIPLIILWANLHAGVLVAIPFLVTYGAWLLYRWLRTRERAWLLAVLPVAVACVAWIANPYGTGLVGLGRRIAETPQVWWVLEWMPFFKPNFPLPTPVYWATLALIALAAWLILRNRRAFHPLELIWLLMLVVLALLQRRQLGLLGVGMPLLLARHLIPLEGWLRRGGAWLSISLVGGLAGLLIWVQVSGVNGNGGGKPGFGRNCTALPCVTADFLALNPPPEPIFNSYNLGGYLLHILSPETKVYIDGRLDTYPHQVWLDLLAVEESRMTIDEIIERYVIETFVIGVADSYGDPLHLASRLAARDDFALVHFDDVAGVFVRRTPDNADYIKRFEYRTLKPWNLNEMARTAATQDLQQQVVNDVGRLLQQSGRSATASALAGFVAGLIGDDLTMSEQLTFARRQQPDNRLLAIVKRRMTTAGRAATR